MYNEEIINALSIGKCPDLLFEKDKDFKPFDQYIDMLFKEKLLIKYGQV